MNKQLNKLIKYLRKNEYTFVLNSVGRSFNIQIEVEGFQDLIIESCDDNKSFKIPGNLYEFKYENSEAIVVWLNEMKQTKK